MDTCQKSQCQRKPLTSKRVRDVNCLVQQQSDTTPPSSSDLFNEEPINSALKKSYTQTHTSIVTRTPSLVSLGSILGMAAEAPHPHVQGLRAPDSSQGLKAAQLAQWKH